MKQGITLNGRTYKRLILGAVGLLMASGGSMASAQLAPVTTANLGKGWNLGNSLEAEQTRGKFPLTTSQETLWGNPVVTQQIFNGIAAAGFKSVRIPVSWGQYMDSKYTIQPFWLARVKQVVDMARNAGLYVIINQHHDHGEFDPVPRREAVADAKLRALWTQVGNYFKDYDNRLLFAGTNEIHHDYGPPSAENCRIQSEFNQVFVSAVRATGGNNATRTLISQGYNTNIDYTINICGAPVPTDSTTGRQMMEFHFYDPWSFAGDNVSTHWQWGNIATDPAATAGWGNEDFVEAQFNKLKTTYADKGIPIIIGEYGAILKSEYDAPMKYRNYWDQYVTGSAVRHGFATYYWDNGYADNHQFGLFNRSTGAQYYPTTVNSIITAQ
jgi:endoglucanase